MAEMRSIKIEVGGERFQIKTDLTDEELNEIVRFIEERIKLHSNPRVEARRGLLLMALDIASELFDAKKRVNELESLGKEAQERAERLVRSIAEAESESSADADIL